ncbi:MAG: NADH-quinone oxidoreductase subunit H [Methanosarcinaceae archaeon]|nr:NADH-quinone oxidoreductase subunit H [Methanosarcinaceae archaeon]
MSPDIFSNMGNTIFSIVMVLAQIFLIILFAPLLSGISKKTKAFFQLRKGPGIFQTYYDLAKLFRKESVVSHNASWIFYATPIVSFVAILTAGLLIPTYTTHLPLGFAGDIIAVMYLFAVARFFVVLVGLDTGSAFGGMGSSREMFVAALVEPAMMLSIFAVAVSAGSTNLGHIAQTVSVSGLGAISPAYLFAVVAFFIIIIAETGRIPVDNPATHLELTMIHEAMLLEYSGKQLAIIELATMMKQLLIFSLFANIFFPWGIWSGTGFGGSMITVSAIAISITIYLAKIAIIAVCVAISETSTAKWRMFRLTDLLSISLILSFLSIVSFIIARGV